MDSESNDRLENTYLVKNILDKYENDGYVRAKVDIDRVGSEFFCHKTLLTGTPINSFSDFYFDSISKGKYTCKLEGVWRKKDMPNSGFLLKVMAVLVKGRRAGDTCEDHEEKAFQKLLSSRYLNSEQNEEYSDDSEDSEEEEEEEEEENKNTPSRGKTSSSNILQALTKK